MRVRGVYETFGLSALIAMLSAFAAWRSASASRMLAKKTAEVERQRLILSVARIAQQTLSKAGSLRQLCDEIKVTYDALATFNGSYGSSRHKLFKDRVDSNRAQGAAITAYIENSIPDEKPIDALADGEISDLLLKLTMKREELIELSDVLSQEKMELKSQLLIYQEQAARHQ
ncbi:hypothetical protein [uncultured Marinobacter sp.]|uniref:hypothetical protein n=1 Tax=uncultured Marinobacter sp. TaxID=187379 RepID=UPI0030D95F49|tara:strand:- start:887 stop:1405 length:519 start_codon:yes stop_codon:yes gene_type:complete